MRDFRSLRVWQASHSMVLEVYRASAGFPRAETYGLTSQLRRAAVSVASNIAEACGRGGDLDFRRFIQVALGSASETEYQILLAKDLGYLEPARHDDIVKTVHQVKRMLSRLRDQAVKRPARVEVEMAEGRRPMADGKPMMAEC